jgi:hypothetical protein
VPLQAKVRAEPWKLRELGERAYPKYVAIQLEIRKHLTAEEFAN